MRRFILTRKVDHHGNSGTGIVAEGVEFSDGEVVLHWKGGTITTTVFKRIEDVMFLHNHEGTELEGGTSVKWIDK